MVDVEQHPIKERHRRFRTQRRRIESGGDPPFPYRQAEHDEGGDREVGNSHGDSSGRRPVKRSLRPVSVSAAVRAAKVTATRR